MKQEQLLTQVTPPPELQELQYWFGHLINRALDDDNLINPIAPNGVVITKEAARYITPSASLRPHQRLQIYNQQYWWRLQEVLQTNFPLILHLLGTEQFNKQIVVPYLSTCLPDHWSLNHLGEKLPHWIQEHYHLKNKQLIYESACLDWLVSLAVINKHYPPLDAQFLTQEDPDILIKKPLCLQPSLSLVRFQHDLPSFRDQVIKEKANFWLTHDLPDLATDRQYHFVIFRNSQNNIAWKDIEAEEFLILQHFQKEKSIEEVCEWMEELEADQYMHMATHLQKWMQEWTSYGWLTFRQD